MNKLFLSFFAIFFLSISFLEAKEKSISKVKQKPVSEKIRKEMNSISGLVRDMGPFIASEQEFIN